MKAYVTYTPELGEKICRTISCTWKSIRRLCEENPDWPSSDTIRRWVLDHEVFRVQYARAKSVQVEWLAEEAMEIAHDGSSDTITDEKGKKKMDHEWAARSRLKIDTIKWYASKIAPKIYGDKIQVETTDLAKDPQIQAAIVAADKLKADDHGRSA